MKLPFLLTMLLQMAHGGIIILLGILIRNHFEMLFSIIFRKSFSVINTEEIQYQKTMKLIRLTGLFIIITGCIQIAASLLMFIF